jgi:hypothetical protein
MIMRRQQYRLHPSWSMASLQQMSAAIATFADAENELTHP